MHVDRPISTPANILGRQVEIDSLLRIESVILLQVAGDVPSELFPSRAGYLLGC
jgi:hypothetical protein